MKEPPKPKIVFSTDPGWKPEVVVPEPAPAGAPSGEGQTAVIRLEKRQKGKVVTTISEIRSHPAGLEVLAKKLKTTCGAGGTVDSGTIEIQGDHRDKIAAALQKMGFKTRLR
ncbi:MAG TPA: translation initiation factor [Planctomycetota bacterium]|nr:translation initiation factor [Planctomycetota bacterium]